MKQQQIQVCVIDDHQSIVDGLNFILMQENDIELCGSAGTLSDAMNLFKIQIPDVAIVDLSLQGEHGLNLIKDCQIQYPQISILVFSMHSEEIYAERAVNAGAKGYVMKSESLTKVVDGIRSVHQGKIYVSEPVKDFILKNKSFLNQDDVVLPISKLSDRELEVFTMIGQGLRPRQIVERLSMSSKTVSSHCRNIRIKLNLADMNCLIESASKWVQVNDPII